MNNRFKTLAVAAGFDPNIFYDSENHDYGKQLAMFEKYCESIVMDCMDIVENAVARREPASTYCNLIRDHFYRDNQKEFELMIKQRCEALAIVKFGRERCNEWWVTVNPGLDNKKPIELDIREVYKYLINYEGK